MSLTSNDSLTRRITLAATPIEIAALLSEGAQYENASQRTRNRWKRKAIKRGMELNGGAR